MSAMSSQANDASSFSLDIMRHSTAHLMAAAIQRLWPATKFGVGPAIENGFYYDFVLPESVKLGEADLEQIEKEMKKIQKEKLLYLRSELSIDEAIKEMEKRKQPFKVELLKLLKEKGSTAVSKETGDTNVAESAGEIKTVSFYQLGDFLDLCRGPHVSDTGQVCAFKLYNPSGAYWRGNEKNPMMTRLYGLAYTTQEEIEKEMTRMEQTKLRDHRKLGKELGLFTFSEEVGQGLPLWLPNGTALKNELEHLAIEQERKGGYVRVSTPVITKDKLYYQSGHLPYYKEDMYNPIVIDEENYYLRPMNCPHHHQVYLSQPRSYRELPLRIAEYGQVFRYEKSGALSGLMRTRGFCQNDAHIYCRYDQVEEEFLEVIRLHVYYYELMGITNYYMRLSLPDMDRLDKYVDQPVEWKKAVDIIRVAMEKSGYRYKEASGDAAFYGPKIDFIITSSVGNEYAISTNQLDFLACSRFNLAYTGDDGKEHPVYVIHRAPLGSHERFVAFLIEHYAGLFPAWLAPIQARIIPISDDCVEYAKKVEKYLFSASVNTGTGGLRVDTDTSSARMEKKILFATQQKIPYMLVVGKKEMQNNTVAVRLRSGKNLGAMPLEQFLERVKKEVAERKDIAV